MTRIPKKHLLDESRDYYDIRFAICGLYFSRCDEAAFVPFIEWVTCGNCKRIYAIRMKESERCMT